MSRNPSRVFNDFFNKHHGEFGELDFDENCSDSPTKVMKYYLFNLKYVNFNIEGLTQTVREELTKIDKSEDYQNFLIAFFEYFENKENHRFKKMGEDSYHDSYETYINFFISNPQYLKYILNDMNFVVRLLEESLKIKIEDLSEEIKKNPGLSETLLEHHIDNIHWYLNIGLSETLEAMPTLFILSLIAAAFVGLAALTSFSGVVGITCLVIAALIEVGVFASFFAYLANISDNIRDYKKSEFAQIVYQGIPAQKPILATKAHEGSELELTTLAPK